MIEGLFEQNLDEIGTKASPEGSANECDLGLDARGMARKPNEQLNDNDLSLSSNEVISQLLLKSKRFIQL